MFFCNDFSRSLGRVYIEDSHLSENMIQDSGSMAVCMNGSTGTK